MADPGGTQQEVEEEVQDKDRQAQTLMNRQISQVIALEVLAGFFGTLCFMVLPEKLLNPTVQPTHSNPKKR